MKEKKMSFEELSTKATQMTKEEQLQMVGGRKNRGGGSSWSGGRGGIIDDDNEVRIKQGWIKGGL